MKKIGIAMAGFGYIGKVHLLGYKDIPLIYQNKLPKIEMKAVCRSSSEKAALTAIENGFEKGYSSFDEMLLDKEINIIDIVTPNYLHKEQIIKALEAGKDVLCEKPLGLNSKEAEEISAAVKKTGKQLGMIFNYRFIPAIQQAKKLINEGRLGKVYSFRGEYFHTGYQDAMRPLTWRMQKDKSGGGALVDMGVHVLDLIRFLLGEFETVNGKTQTFIRERPLPDNAGQMGEVTVDDAAWLTASLKGGATGTVEISRFATGSLDDLKISAFGEKGAFKFDLMDANYLYWYDEGQGWRRIETLQHYEDTKFPSPRSIIGWTRFHVENQYRFLESVVNGKSFKPDVNDGLAVQRVIDGIYKSASTGLNVNL
ncbi:MAG: Gfo/Idh/MocA family oxidoreductase [Spirochaetia bacterium]|nr:Gfo/Idh/MocA family oxidoreductase [Spirochaetia bacterium]